MSKQSKRHMGLEVQGDLVTSNSLMFRNRIINGDMRIAQRGTSASASGNGVRAYGVDRFYAVRSTNINTLTAEKSTTAPAGFQNSLLITSNASAQNPPPLGDSARLIHAIEGYNVADLDWGTVNAKSITLSFWTRSSVAGTFGIALTNATSTRSYIASYTISSVDTWEYKTITVPGCVDGVWATDTDAGLYLQFDLGVGSNSSAAASSSWYNTYYTGLTGGVKLVANASASFYLTGVQLEVGSSASAFEHRPYGMELQLCQRYYETKDLRWLDAHYVASTNRFVAGLISCTYKRATPAVNVISGTIYWANGAVILSAVSNAGLSFIVTTNESIFLYQTRQVGNSTPASNEFVFMESGIVIGINAEL